jgi:hypothetical protein
MHPIAWERRSFKEKGEMNGVERPQLMTIDNKKETRFCFNFFFQSSSSTATLKEETKK